MHPPRVSPTAPTPQDVKALLDCLNQARFADLEVLARKLTQRFPRHGLGWKALGLAAAELGRDAQALEAFRRGVALMPDDAQAQAYLAHALKKLGRLADAEAAYRRALALRADFPEALNHLGETLHRLGRPAEAEACYRQSLGIQPNDPHTHNSLGVMLKNQGRHAAAEAAYRRALEIRPEHAEALANLGVVLKRQDRLAEAETCYRRALALQPQAAATHSNLGVTLMEQGRMDEAEASFRRALALDPTLVDARSNLLFVFNHLAAHRPQDGLDEALRYGRIVAGRVTRRFETWTCEPRPARLRVGIVSGDLRTHPVGYFLDTLLPALAQGGIELIAYPTHHLVDALTERLKPSFRAWKPLTGLGDGEAAALIHADGVHVLLDLSGHTAHNRLPVFAWKPAPVQASWLGYFATTGVAEIDWLIADEVGVPAGEERHFSEKVWRLPHTRLCFSPPHGAPEVSTLPALKNGHITFGCFQSLAKVGEPVLTAWAAILRGLPRSRLRLQAKQLADPVVVEALRRRLQDHGVEAGRIALHRQVPREDYLAAHAEVDLLLDTFPYPGGTTTCEALWMGVPTLTLAGDRLLARQGASLLSAAGLPGWIASSESEYVDKALHFAGDVPGLAQLRAGLRTRVQASPLFDAAGFAVSFEEALWGLWAARERGPR